ncbi:MAG: sigma-70 family RNA polymerase sigma factor [Treponema sp.]|nr:sigma-70 family RNA polymerase sigma factor [Treponema sp.]
MEIDIQAYYEKYSPMVYRRCKQLLKHEDDALDALQDVFIKLMNNKHKLKGTYPSSLLYVIATNTCLNKIRWKKRQNEHSEGEFIENMHLSYDQGFDQVEAKMLTKAILETESESTRSICFMYYADDMTLEEIGQAVGMSISGVRKRLLAFQKRAKITLEEGKNG